MVINRESFEHGIRICYLLLHKLKQNITEDNIANIIKAMELHLMMLG